MTKVSNAGAKCWPVLKISLGDEQLEAFPVNIDDLHSLVVFQVLAQFSDVHIHTSPVEVIVIAPDGVQSIIAFEQAVFVFAQEVKELVLFGGEFIFVVA